MGDKDIEQHTPAEQTETPPQNNGVEKQEVKEMAHSLKDLKKLEQEVATSTNREKLIQLGNEVPHFCSDKAMSVIDTLTKNPDAGLDTFDKETLEWFDTFVGWRLVGSAHGKLLRDARNTDGSIDVQKYTAAKQGLNIDTLPQLDTALKAGNTEFDANEQKVMQLLSGNSAFAQKYMESRYTKVVSVMDTYVSQNIEEYNAYVKQHPETAADTPEKKSVWEKTKDFAKEHPYITAAGIGLGIWGLYKLFSRKKKKSEDGEGNDEEKGFFDTTVGKIVKWGAIGAGAYWLINSLMDGSLLESKTTGTDSPEEQNSEYKKHIESHPEDKEIYESMGANVDGVYNRIYSKELAAGWQDEAQMEEISKRASGGADKLKGIVPWCLDQEKTSVDKLFSEGGQSMDFLSEGTQYVKDKAFGLIQGSGSYLWKGFLGMFGASGDPKEAFNKWFNEDPEKHAQEIKFFFREKVRVQTFLLQKQKSLVEHIASEKLPADGKYADVHEAIEDKEWLQKNVYEDPRYTAFRSGDIKNAYQILTAAGLMNGSIDDETKKIVSALDEQRDDMLLDDGKDILLAGQEQMKSGSIDKETQQSILKACSEISTELDTEVIEAAQENAWSSYSDLFDGDEKAKRDFLQHTGLDTFGQTLKQGLATYTQKISAGKMTPEEYKDFTNLVNQYFALKKEIYCGTDTVEYIHNPDGSWSVKAKDFFRSQLKSIGVGLKKLLTGEVSESLKYLLGGGVVLTVLATGIVYIGKTGSVTGGAIKLGKTAVGLTFGAPRKIVTAGAWTTSRIGGKMYGPAWALRKRFFPGEAGPKRLVDALKEGRITLDKSEQIIRNGSKSKWLGGAWKKDVNASWGMHDTLDIKSDLIKKAYGTSVTDADAKLISKYFDQKGVRTLLKKDSVNTLNALKKIEAAGVTDPQLIDQVFAKKPRTIGDLERSIQSTLSGKEVWKDAVRLGLNAEQTVLHTTAITEIERLERLAPTSSMVEKAVHQKEIEALKGFAQEVKNMNPENAKAIIELSKDIRINYLAKMVDEGADVKQIVNMFATAKARGVPLDAGYVESILTHAKVPKFAEELKNTQRLVIFGEEAVKVGEASKIVKLDKALVEILRLIKYIK